MAIKNKEIEVQDTEKEEMDVVEGTERTRPGKVYIPRTDIYETADTLVIVADMPGVAENSVGITLEKNILRLKGTVEFEHPENHSLTYAEYSVGNYERSFTISNEIDQDNIEATINNGVLKVYLPKAGPAKSRKISVKSA